MRRGFDAAGGHQLRRLENVDGRKVAVFSLALVDVGQGRVGGAEIDADFHAATRSRTLNSSFQRRPSRATHQSCSMPVSVTTVSKETGTTSDEFSPAPEADFHGRQLFQFVAEVFDQVAGLVVLARRRGEEAELGGLADHQAEFAARNADVGAFFHAERHHRERLERRREAGDGGHGAFHADVVGARHAAADAHTASCARQAVIGRAARHRVHQIFAAQAA